jgi:hypothetical protein
LQAHDHHGGGGGGGCPGGSPPGQRVASTTPNAFIVPRFFSGPFFAVAGWPKLFFPFGTRFSPVLITGYQVTYGAWTRCGPQRWINSSANGHGNLPFDGNIRGC